MDHFPEKAPLATLRSDPCRLCLRRSCGNFLLFEYQISDTPLTVVIRDIFGVELISDSNLPKYVCECCLRKIECLQNFREELIKCQMLLSANQEESGLEPIEEYLSDDLFEQVEKLDGLLVSEDEGVKRVKNVEIEAIDFNEEQPLKEQLVNIKIEALRNKNELLVEVENLSDPEMGVEPTAEHLEEAEEEFHGFEVPVPVKLEVAHLKQRKRGQRKRNASTEGLEVIETVPNKCYICNEVLNDEHDFEVHLANHTDMLPYHCEQCSTETNPIEIKTLRLLNKHFESHGFNFACSHCPLKFRSYPPLYDHTRNAHDISQQDFDCDVCGVKFNEVRKFRKHMLAHKNRQLERYKCEICSKSFQTGTILRRHERIHRQEVLFECPFCGRGFNHESNFRQHKMRHIRQQKEAEVGHPCTVCEIHFTNATDLRKHMAEHYPDDPLYTTKLSRVPESLKDGASYPRPCEEPNCQYIAPTYTLMWSHYRNHYKMYPCAECDRKFGTATILKKHVEIVHRKIRKYQCEFCEKTFGYQHKYREHMDGHKGIKRRQCRYCDKTFTHSSNLIVHERIHTSTKPYSCQICGSRYVTSSALKKHQRTHMKKNQGKPGNEQQEQEYLDTELVYLMDGDIQDAIEEEVVVN